MIQPEIICLVGSVNQEKDWRNYTAKLTSKGYVVFEAGLYDNGVSKEIWDLVTLVHWKKIDMSNIVAVIRKQDGSIGRHTQEDIDYAKKQGKKICDVKEML